MSRLVVPKGLGAGELRADTPDKPDGYSERVIKYIPSEAIVFYLAADGVVRVDTGSSAMLLIFGSIVFLVGLIGTPLYFRRQAKPNQPWKVQATICTLAFVIWAYAVGGSIFTGLGLRVEVIATILPMCFTFLVGAIEPRA